MGGGGRSRQTCHARLEPRPRETAGSQRRQGENRNWWGRGRAGEGESAEKQSGSPGGAGAEPSSWLVPGEESEKLSGRNKGEKIEKQPHPGHPRGETHNYKGQPHETLCGTGEINPEQRQTPNWNPLELPQPLRLKPAEENTLAAAGKEVERLEWKDACVRACACRRACGHGEVAGPGAGRSGSRLAHFHMRSAYSISFNPESPIK